MKQQDLMFRSQRVHAKIVTKLQSGKRIAYIMDTFDRDDSLDEGGEAPNGGDTMVQFVKGSPVEESTRMA